MIVIKEFNNLVAEYQNKNGLKPKGKKSLEEYISNDYQQFLKKGNAEETAKEPFDEEKVLEYLNAKLYQMLGDAEWIGDGKETFDFNNPASEIFRSQYTGFTGVNL